MEHFEYIYRMCKSFTEKPGVDIEYQSPAFSIKVKSKRIQLVKNNKPVQAVNKPASAPKTNVLSENIGFFVRSLENPVVPPVNEGGAVRKGQIIGLCVFGDFFIPVRAPASGLLERYLIPDGGQIEYGTEIASLIEE